LIDYAENKRTTIPEAYIRKLEKKVVNEAVFNEKQANNACLACKFFYFWVQALFDFDKIFKQTAPLREKLAACTKIVNEKTAILTKATKELDALNA